MTRDNRPIVLILCISSLAGCAGTGSGGAQSRAESARYAYLEGDVDVAARDAKLALQDDPLDSDSHFLLACVLAEEGQIDQAIVGFRRAHAVDPTHHVAAYNQGTMLLRRNEPIPAARLFEAALASSPDHVPSYNNLGKAYFLAGLPELAVASYEEALRRDPSNAIALDNLATIRAAAGHRAPREGPRSAGAAAEEQAPVAGSDAPGSGSLEDGASDMAGLRDLIADMPYVRLEQRAGRPTLSGWTRGESERVLLERVLQEHADVRDLTTDDVGDPQRMIEVDATIFVVITTETETKGFNFLRMVNFSFDFFSSDHDRDGTGFSAPGSIGAVDGSSQSGWLLSASVDYDVTIANAVDDRVAILARPHLTTLSGTPATFLAGGEFVFRVSGNISGDIKPYPFGTSLDVTPTLLRTPGEDGRPRVHVKVAAGRKSVLELLAQTESDAQDAVVFDTVDVTAEAVLDTEQTLILSGLNQKERRSGRAGVPYLRSIPIIKYFFSTATSVEVDTAVIILLTPRDPAFRDEQNRASLEEFIEKRRAFVAARRGTEEDFQRFTERYPDWREFPPNRFTSHFFLLENSQIYRLISGEELTEEDIEFDVLGTQLRP